MRRSNEEIDPCGNQYHNHHQQQQQKRIGGLPIARHHRDELLQSAEGENMETFAESLGTVNRYEKDDYVSHPNDRSTFRFEVLAILSPFLPPPSIPS